MFYLLIRNEADSDTTVIALAFIIPRFLRSNAFKSVEVALAAHAPVVMGAMKP